MCIPQIVGYHNTGAATGHAILSSASSQPAHSTQKFQVPDGPASIALHIISKF